MLRVFAFVFFLLSGVHHTASWQIQKGYKIEFTITNFGLPVKGSLSGLKGEIKFDPAKPEAGRFDVSIPVKTINTGIKKRDEDLMNEKYFYELKYPEIIYKSEKISKKNTGYIASGTLTIKGKAKKTNLPFSFISHNDGGGIFESQLTL